LSVLSNALKANEGKSNKIYISHLGNIDQLRSLMNSEDKARSETQIETIKTVFEGIVQLDSQIMKEQLESIKNIDKIDEAKNPKVDKVLIEACQKFLLSLSEEIATKYYSTIEKKAKRSTSSYSESEL